MQMYTKGWVDIWIYQTPMDKNTQYQAKIKPR
jgi:hypothetical protein